jgi:hypothetical protein
MAAQQYSILSAGRYAKDAYENAVEKYIIKEGDNNYNGTISTSNGAVMVINNLRYGTKKYWKWVDEQWDHLEKRGPAMCKEIRGKHAEEYKNSMGLKEKKALRVFHFFGWGAC